MRPYHIYMCDQVAGAEHFRTTVEKGLEIVKALRGLDIRASPFPTLSSTLQEAAGRSRCCRNTSCGSRISEVVLRNYAGKTYRYSQPVEPILVG